MLLRLRHDPFIRRNHKKHQIHTDHSCHHVIDEPLVPRYVDNAHTIAARQVKIREPEIDRDPSSLFFLPPVCIPSRQRLDQRRLAMIYMACCSYDDILHIPYS